MVSVASRRASAQIPMPGMYARMGHASTADCCTVEPGQQVLYLGDIVGGPCYGSTGTVKEVRLRKAVVDMGRSGTWHIPYYFLIVPDTD